MNKEFLEGVAPLLQIKAEDVAGLFVTEGEETKLKEGVDPLKTVSDWVKTRLDDVYKAAQRKTATRFEDAVKQKGFESDLQGVELLNAYLETLKDKPGNGGGDVSEWEKKYNDLFPKVEAFETQISTLKGDYEQKLKARDQAVVQSRLRGDVRSALGNKWAGTDQHLDILLNSFSVDRIRYDGNTPILLDQSGEPLLDELHRPVQFGDHVKGLGELIGGFHAVDAGKGSPPPPNGGSGAHSGITLPSNLSQKDYNEMLDRERDPVKRKQLVEARIAQLDKK